VCVRSDPAPLNHNRNIGLFIKLKKSDGQGHGNSFITAKDQALPQRQNARMGCCDIGGSDGENWAGTSWS
jgi:hypothetical protein